MYISTCIYVCIHLSIYLSVNLSIFIFIYMYVCIYIYSYITVGRCWGANEFGQVSGAPGGGGWAGISCGGAHCCAIQEQTGYDNPDLTADPGTEILGYELMGKEWSGYEPSDPNSKLLGGDGA